jgi:mono/diheme cytochrome c family protein
MSRSWIGTCRGLGPQFVVVVSVASAACSQPNTMTSRSRADIPPASVALSRVAEREARGEQGGQAQILRGRTLVVHHACSGCHSGVLDPAGPGYLAGARSAAEEFTIEGFRTRPRNLTPDNETGLGRFSERQIFNALRYGLRPGETPDVEITSTTPGQGNFPARPKYLAPPMPWASWRHLSDQELWDIAAYLKRAVKPVNHRVADSEGPPDFWASYYAKRIGPNPAVPFPTSNEASNAAANEQVQRGRALVLSHACGECHGGYDNPAADGWLSGARLPTDTFRVGPFTLRPRNLTPDVETGTGRYSERQIFNALRYGLRPSETPDVEITSTVPGQGNHPAQPKYLGPSMPWFAWRHMSDQQLRDIAAYLKRGLKPVKNKVPDSEGPPDFWASGYTVEAIGPYPASPYPTANEKVP